LPISGAPEQGCRTIPTTFYLLKKLFNRTTFGEAIPTGEQLTLHGTTKPKIKQIPNAKTASA